MLLSPLLCGTQAHTVPTRRISPDEFMHMTLLIYAGTQAAAHAAMQHAGHCADIMQLLGYDAPSNKPHAGQQTRLGTLTLHALV